MSIISRKIRRLIDFIDFYRVSTTSKIILSAGMPRSGSTWLYNAARLLLISSSSVGNNLSSGWIEDLGTLSKKEVMLIKIHDLPKFLSKKSQIILYSYRDLRDALASSKRKFGNEPSMDKAK